MRNILKKCSAVWLLFAGFAVSTIFIVSGIGYYVISRDYQRFNTEALHLRAEYIASQRQQIKQEVEQVVAYIQYNWTKAEERLRENLKDRTDEAFAIAANLYRVNHGRANDRETRNIIREPFAPSASITALGTTLQSASMGCRSSVQAVLSWRGNRCSTLGIRVVHTSYGT